MPMSATPDRPRASDLIALLGEVEARFPVRDWRIGGVAIWPLVRMRWFFAEWARHYVAPSRVAERGIATKFLGALRSQWPNAQSRQSGQRRRRSDTDAPLDVLFLADGVSHICMGDTWIDRLVDPLLSQTQALGLKGAVWTRGQPHDHAMMFAATPVQPGVDRAKLAGALRAGLRPLPAQLPESVGLVNWLHSRGLQATELVPAQVQLVGACLHAVAASFKTRLLINRPRIAFLSDFYGLEGMAFILACRQAAIPTVDVQHGVQGPHHPAYAAWPKPPDGKLHELLADRFWVWSHDEVDVIEKWCAGTSHAAVAGGDQWLYLWRQGMQWPGLADVRSQAAHLEQAAQGRRIVLVTLQVGLSDAEQLDPLVELLGEPDPRLYFWVRLHPAMLKDRELIRSRLGLPMAYELDGPTDLPLFALLAHADVHMTHSSSAVIEAAQFGVRSVITSAFGAEYFQTQLTTGLAVDEFGSKRELESALVNTANAPSVAVIKHQEPLSQVLTRLLAQHGIHKKSDKT